MKKVFSAMPLKNLKCTCQLGEKFFWVNARATVPLKFSDISLSSRPFLFIFIHADSLVSVTLLNYSLCWINKNDYSYCASFCMAGPEHGHERAVRVPGDGAEDEGDLCWGHHPPEAPSTRGDQGGQDTRHRQRPRRYSGIPFSTRALQQIMKWFMMGRPKRRSSLNIWTRSQL